MKKLYVGNLPYTFSSAELATLFEEFGVVTAAEVLIDHESGRSRGFGFVTMALEDAAGQAMRGLDGRPLQGRRLRVTEAREREARVGGPSLASRRGGEPSSPPPREDGHRPAGGPQMSMGSPQRAPLGAAGDPDGEDDNGRHARRPERQMRRVDGEKPIKPGKPKPRRFEGDDEEDDEY